MADRRRKPGTTGRVTAKGGPATPAPSPAARRRPDPTKPVQVGRRPSTPRFLVLVGLMWLAVGVIMLLTFKATWKYIPGIVSLGIGLLFLRGAGSTVLRREHRRSSEK